MVRVLNVFGDDLEIRYEHPMWVAPSCGSRHPRAVEAMEVELRAYVSACGEVVESEEMMREMDSLLAGFDASEGGA